MATAAAPRATEEPSDEIKQGAWQLLAAGDTRCISQVETPGMQAVLRRVREAADGSARPPLASLEDLAQLLALWRPGAYAKEREQAYLTARFGSQQPAILHPSLAPILGPTFGELLYAVMWTLTFDSCVGYQPLGGYTQLGSELFWRSCQ
ncbi:MAG: hypothetical protein JOZ87_01080 [Chloroflexi bacterium]|nr:hypothetical protein [Chloroflexota bacterium]